MKKILSSTILGLGLISGAQADDNNQYEVTITNATPNHVFTPVLITTHSKNVNVFEIGLPASDGLVHQAENGDPSVLVAELQGTHGVYNTFVGGFVPHGQQATYIIDANKKSRLSLTSMLATTNDGFTGLNSVKLPKKSATYYAHVYDAGSETNNEDCSFIPGPPCVPDSGNARALNGEGFVTIHNGVHGQGDLNPQTLDWRGPVAVITIKKVDD